jgi:hypothetical protein
MSHDPITVAIISRTPQKFKGRCGNIVDSVATDTPDMAVRRDIAVEAGLGTAHFDLLDHARPGEQFEVAIDRAEADFGNTAADNLIQPDCGRV